MCAIDVCVCGLNKESPGSLLTLGFTAPITDMEEHQTKAYTLLVAIVKSLTRRANCSTELSLDNSRIVLISSICTENRIYFFLISSTE